MSDQTRLFEAGPDPFGRMWKVQFRWLQTGISIRHADTVDVKFFVSFGWRSTRREGDRFASSGAAGTDAQERPQAHRPILHAAGCRASAAHDRNLRRYGEDLVTVSPEELAAYDQQLNGATGSASR